jgi:hypothetical protein
MRKANILNHQSLIDFALHRSGSVDAFFNLAFINGYSLTDDITPGTELLLGEIVDFKNQQYFQNSIYKPTTGLISAPDLAGGIEFWAIEMDFIIS